MQNRQRLNRVYILPYLAFWLAIGIVYEALFLLSPEVNLSEALIAGLQIIGVAALLGLFALHFAIRSPMPQDNLFLCLLLHSTAAFAYSVLWIGTLIVLRSIEIAVSEGEFGFNLPRGFVLRWHFIAGPLLYTAIVTAVFAARSLERSQIILKHAELQALRAKLNPHFLFNTLHTIMMLFRSDANKAEEAIEKFSDLIRYSFHSSHGQLAGDKNALASLENEWLIARKYLDLEQLRLGDNLRITTKISEEALNFMSPQLLLQPLVENAVIHGASRSEDGADILIKIELKNSRVLITIENDGLDPVATINRDSESLGLKAVKAGLESTYGNKAMLTAGIVESNRFQVRVEMPAQRLTQL